MTFAVFRCVGTEPVLRNGRDDRGPVLLGILQVRVKVVDEQPGLVLFFAGLIILRFT
jgi:hypothetical protein